MSRLLAVAAKTWREMIRDRKGFAITVGLPLVFVAIFGFAFGQSDQTDTYPLALLDEDRPVRGFSFGANLTGVLENATYGSGQRIFEIQRVASAEEGRRLLEDRDVAAMLTIPAGFSAAMARAPGANATLVVGGDPSYTSFNVASGILTGILESYRERAGGAIGPDVRTRTASIASDELEPFDFIAPGLMVFAILNMAPQAAAILARERERKTLERLRLTDMRALELLGGVSLAELGVAVISLTLMVAAALLLGFHAQGSIPLAIGIGVLSAFAVLGVGMVIAAFADKQDDAANLGIIFSVPASFLSGAFFPIPRVDLFTLGDRVIQIYDILPSTHAVRALRDILTLGRGFGDVLFEVGALVVLTALYFAVGAYLYSRRRLRALG